MSMIGNFDDEIPKKYRKSSAGEIHDLDIKSLFRMVILGPSYSGKTNLFTYIIKHSPHVFSHLHIIARNPNQPVYNYLKDKLEGFITFHEDPPNVDHIRATPPKKPELVLIDDYSNDFNVSRQSTASKTVMIGLLVSFETTLKFVLSGLNLIE